ncbi:TetR/AcrR family transcriptional regulator [Flavobacterium gilvum]|uniref:HTH tetR-type domain-containing protein n=1 Tax=Flavobacterium gilvum TaxID=1492737 RepID=A0AAC9N5Z3_9FLAO|nr:TetR/AcrR family transcriptional regulator [Flavobacterium gilvum]AOW10511.1 hypothetical protein EM308_13920 [Flavobacterium gilvum]KFC59986.1 hypothetical protein FEM08_12330 [Flavobacterium gilvum]
MKDTKQYILDTSFKLFLNKTFKEVSMKELVDATGLSKGAFYHYFSSKEQLFREVIEKFLLDKMMFYYDGLDKSSLKNFYSAFLDFIKRERTDNDSASKDVNFVTLILEAIKLFPELRQNFSQVNELELNIWVAVIANAKLSGEINSKMSNENIAQIFIFTKVAVGIRKNFGIEITSDKMMAEKLNTLWSDFYNELKCDSFSKNRDNQSAVTSL